MVKTRLVPPLDPDAAAAVHARLLKRALATARSAALGPLTLACSPDTSHPFFQHCAARYGAALVTQADGDLGTRMLAASRDVLATGMPVILLGCDCPALTVAHMRAAARALAEGDDAVFIPVEDGGYALLGLARVEASLFEDTAWGGDEVMATARKRLTALGWRWSELETLWDVDRPADYERLVESGLLGSPDGPYSRQA